MEIKSFTPISKELDTWVRLKYQDDEVITENVRVIGYGIISDQHGDFVEPFYYLDNEILSPSRDATNLLEWTIL